MSLRTLVGTVVIPIFSAILIAGGMVAIASDSGCGAGTTIPTAPIDVAFCILDIVSKDLLAGMGYQAAFADAATRCLGGATADNVATVSKMWDAHVAASDRLRVLDGGK